MHLPTTALKRWVLEDCIGLRKGPQTVNDKKKLKCYKRKYTQCKERVRRGIEKQNRPET